MLKKEMPGGWVIPLLAIPHDEAVNYNFLPSLRVDQLRKA